MAAIMTLCGDPGGAEAIAPVIQHLRQDGRLALTCLAYRQAGRILSRHGLTSRSLSDSGGLQELEQVFRATRPDAVLVATSFNGVDLERALTRMAHAAGVPTMAVVDFWSHYRERFDDPSGTKTILPDRIAVMDKAARVAMIREGFAAERLLVTGQPALDSARRLSAGRRGMRATTRQRWKVPAHAFVALYVSQPIRFDHHRGHALRAFDPRSRALSLLMSALTQFSRRRGRTVVLVVRPHPRDRSVQIPVRPRVAIRIDRSRNRYAAILGSDAVFGQNTMMMVEARALGAPVYSLRTDEPQHMPLGDIPRMRFQREVADTIECASRIRWHCVSRMAPAGTSAQRIARALLHLIGLESRHDG